MLKLLNTKSIFKKWSVLAFSFVVLLTTAIVVNKNIQTGIVEAANDNTAAVSSDGNPILYDDTVTYHYSVTVNGKTHNALCAEPHKAPPAGDSYSYSSLNNNKIKLLVYLAINIDDEEDSAATNAAKDLAHALYDDLVDPSYSNPDDIKNQIFAYIHATIGAINNDYNGLSTANRSKIENIANGTSSGSLAYAISNNNDAWLVAKNYTLYATQPDDDLRQSVVWIESNFQYGSISVQKCDNETKSCETPQGKASFSGIKFEVRNANGSRIYNPKNNQFYNNGDLIASGTTNSTGQVTFSNLPTGITYRVKEATTNTSYLLTASDQTTTNLTTNGDTLKFYDDIVRGDVKFVKVDQNNDSTPMANVPFKITSKTTGENHIVVSDVNGVVNTATINHNLNTNNYDSISDPSSIVYRTDIGTWFGQLPANNSRGALPYDEYIITEISCDQNQYCYDIDSQQKSFTINSDSTVVNLDNWDNECAEFSLQTTAVDDADGDKFIESSATVKIKDTVSYCLKEGLEYTISGVLMDKNTGVELKINDQPITASKTFTPTTACDAIDLTFTFNATDLAGHELVVYESLYHGEELITSHEDLDDDSQTVSIISLSTYATDNSDGDKIISADTDVTIKDVVSYCLKAGEKYTFSGTLMNKDTKKSLLIDKQKVEKTVEFTPEESCGEFEVFYDLNTSNISEATLVVFESLYDKDDNLIISHADFENLSETIAVAPRKVPSTTPDSPETGSTAINENNKNNENYIITPAILMFVSGLIVYIKTRLISKRKFLS